MKHGYGMNKKKKMGGTKMGGRKATKMPALKTTRKSGMGGMKKKKMK